MASTYTLNNGIELIGTGEQSGTWGDTTNTNLSLLDTALDGQVTVTLPSAGTSGSPNTLAIADGSASDGRNRMVIFNDGGDLGATAYVQLTPNDAEKIIYIRNDLAGSRSIILFQGTYNASNDYEVPAGTTAVIYFDGAGSGAVAANVFNNAYFDSLRLGSVSVTAILDEDNMASDSATALATQQSIKAYVDSQVTAQDLDFAGDSGTGAVDLDSQTFTIAGTTNEIETSASGQTLTVGLPDNVTIAGDLTVDTDTLYVDSTNNRVGIGTSSPSVPLHIDIGTDNNAIYIESSDQFANIGLVDGGGSGKIIMDGGDLSLTSGGDATTSFTGSTEAMRVDSSQRVLINTNTSRVVGGSAEAVTQIYNTSNGALLSLFRNQASNNGGAIIRGGKARNNAIVQDNDTIFSLEAVAHDGTDMGSFAGTIAFLVDGTPGANDTPSRIAFYTTADGSASGSERMRITSSGDVGIGTNSPDNSLHVAYADSTAYSDATGDFGVQIENTDSTTNAFSQLHFRTGNSDSYIRSIREGDNLSSLAFLTDDGGTTGDVGEAMRIDSSQRVLIGTTSAIAVAGESNPGLQLIGSGATSNSWFNMARFSDNSGSSVLNFGKSRSNTTGTMTVVQSGDALGIVSAAGADGTDMASVAGQIRFEVDGTPGSNDMPGRLEFHTTADGTATPTERMRISNAGDVSIGTSTDPTVKLDIAYSDATNYGIKIKNTNTTITAKSGITMPVSNGTGGGAIYVDSAVSAGNGNLYDMHLTSFQGASSIIFEPSGGEAMRVDPSQRVLVGHTSAQTFSLTPQVSLLGTDASSSAYQVGRFQNGAFASYYQFAKSRATTVGDHVIIQADDTIGNLRALADDGVNYDAVAASIEFQVDGTPGANDMPGRLVFSTSADGSDSPTERMRITNGGDLLFAKTTAASTTAGMHLDANGKITTTRSSGPAAAFVRLTSDGDIVTFQKDSTTVGKIGTSNSYIYIGEGDVGLAFRGFSDYILPWNPSTNSTRDNAINIGDSAYRFKDLYLSGGVYLGGTGSSNKLDDYEEGTWTPTFRSDGGTTGTQTDTSVWAYYTKIGRQVTVHFNWSGSLSGYTGTLHVDGLPFNVGINYQYTGSLTSDASTGSASNGSNFMFFAYSNSLYPRYNTGTSSGYLYTGSLINNLTSLSGTATYIVSI